MKTYKIYLAIGWSGFISADGQIEVDHELRFFVGSPSNVVARYAKVSVLRVEEYDWPEPPHEEAQ